MVNLSGISHSGLVGLAILTDGGPISQSRGRARSLFPLRTARTGDVSSRMPPKVPIHTGPPQISCDLVASLIGE